MEDYYFRMEVETDILAESIVEPAAMSEVEDEFENCESFENIESNCPPMPTKQNPSSISESSSSQNLVPDASQNDLLGSDILNQSENSVVPSIVQLEHSYSRLISIHLNYFSLISFFETVVPKIF